MIMNEEYTCTFEEKEAIIYSGLLVYLTSQLGEYLTEQQIELMAQVLKKFRTRPADVEFNDSYCKVITNDPEINRLRSRAQELLRQRDERLSLHDFRMVRGSAHTNLIFDVSLPQDLRGQEKEIQNELNRKLNEGSAMTYYTVITFDPAEFNLQA